MRRAAAEVPVQRLADLVIGGPGIALEQRLGRHQHAVAAVAALAGLLLDEGLLQRMGVVDGADALDRGDVALDLGKLPDARARRLPVDQNGAGAALRKPAAELRPVEADI